jgi:Cu+-exporting ATPase
MGLKENKEVIEQDLVCYHCGEGCDNDKIQKEDKLFCCEGCKLVYEILEENSLCSYYSIEPGSGNSPKDDSISGKFSYLDRPDVQEKLIHFKSETQNLTS